VPQRPDPDPLAASADREDWRALADAINARMAERRMRQQALSTASGVSTATLRQLQRGMTGRRAQDATLAAISRALGWPEGHLLAVLLSRTPDPAPAEDPPDEPTLREVCETLRRIEVRLTAMDGRLAAVERAVTAPGTAGAAR
jgi:transcriptional regulator with XRE-family HTH domain